MIGIEFFRTNNPPDWPDVIPLPHAIPMGRLDESSEAAQAVAFFLDETVTCVTGQTLFVCGGLSLETFGASPLTAADGPSHS